MKIKLLILTIFAFSIVELPALVYGQFNYKRRDNRFEGIKEIKVGSPDLELLSFTGYREKTPSESDVILKLKFYLEAKDSLYITAKELFPPFKYYLMKPTKKDWRSGWQLFSPWPTTEVINPLKIKVENIGVVARKKEDRIGSGQIVPLVFYHSNLVSKINSYELFLRPKETLRRVDYNLYPDGSRKPVISKSMRTTLISMEPFLIPLDMTNVSTGQYKLMIKCKIKDKTDGPSRTYTFYHNPVVH